MPCSLFQFLIFFFTHWFTPLTAAVFSGYFHSQMGEPAVRRSAVPVLYTGHNVDHIAGVQLLRLFAPFLIVAPACHADEDLPAALARLVDMPVVAAAGLKGNVGQKQAGFRVGQRVQERLANEKLGISGVCGTGSKNILLLKFMFIHALHTCCLLFFYVPALLCLTLRRWDTMWLLYFFKIPYRKNCPHNGLSYRVRAVDLSLSTFLSGLGR